MTCRCVRDRAVASRPRRGQTRPMTIAASSARDESGRDDSGRPGKATAVATSTTGLIAGDASRKVSAAAGATPRRRAEPAIGTEPHSQPGSAAPATARPEPPATAGRGGSRGGNPRDEGSNRGADSDPEDEERHCLDRDRNEDRRPVREGGLVEELLEKRPSQRREKDDHGDDDHSEVASRHRSPRCAASLAAIPSPTARAMGPRGYQPIRGGEGVYIAARAVTEAVRPLHRNETPEGDRM